MRKSLILLCLGFLVTQTFSSPSTPIEKGQNTYTILPKPVKLDAKNGRFVLKANTSFLISDASLEKTVQAFAAQLNTASGYTIAVAQGSASEKNISFALDASIANAEGYSIEITPKQVVVKASQPAGIFYAIQTLRQLLPAEIEKKTRSNNISLQLPCCNIEDAPRYTYRGMHLDVGRHTFSVDFVKKYIDLMAMHKQNRFHWHLTEDQGWRIEIKKYPKLTSVGGFRKETMLGTHRDKVKKFDGKPYGGFFTQEEVREVVRYAQERFVTVIPEIELPGHSLAALSAYPELSCESGTTFEAATSWGVFKPVFCPKEETFTFLENVLSEVFDLFPSEYVHIGGDEVLKDQWKSSTFCQELMKKEGLKDEHELQSYFIQRIEKFINSKGKKLIGWDEILEGGLSPNATVMSWRGEEGGIAAAKQNHDVIMTPNGYCYLDHYQAKPTDKEPDAIGGYLPVEKVYSYNPDAASLNTEERKHILGVQGNVWTEYITTSDKVEYMAYPRSIALAEVAWSPQATRNYKDFVGRLQKHFSRLDAMGVNYAKHLVKK
jgi:hexosaminidase